MTTKEPAEEGLEAVEESGAEGAVELPGGYIPPLPPLRYRGDLKRRYRTAGTILSVLFRGRAGVGEAGMLPSEVVSELDRLEVKYDDYRRTATEVFGTLLMDSPADVIQVLEMLATFDLVELVVPSGGVAGASGVHKVRLTAEGQKTLDTIYLAAIGPDGDAWVDPTDPLLGLVFAVEGSVDEEVEESELPINRESKKKPSYRQWLWILHNERDVFLLAYAGWEAWDFLGSAESTLEDKKAVPSPVKNTFRTMRSVWRRVKPFSKMVLAGGPESVWVGHALEPRPVHNDVESFYAARRPGYTQNIVDASSLAWEHYDRSEITLNQFARTREYVDMMRLERDTISVLRVSSETTAERLEEGGAGVSTSEIHASIPVGRPETDADRLKALEIESAPHSKWEEDGSTVAAGKTSMDKIEKLVMKSSADSLVQSLGISEFQDSGEIGGIPRIRCDWTRVDKTTDKIRYCGRWSVQGSNRCETHGGLYLDPEETKNVIRSNQTKLVAAGSKAVDTLVYMMMESSNDAIRLRAAEQVLNRIGLSENVDINVTTDDKKTHMSAGEVVRDRLMKLAQVDEDTAAMLKMKEERDEAQAANEANTVDAEVVDDDEVDEIYDDGPGWTTPEQVLGEMPDS